MICRKCGENVVNNPLDHVCDYCDAKAKAEQAVKLIRSDLVYYRGKTEKNQSIDNARAFLYKVLEKSKERHIVQHMQYVDTGQYEVWRNEFMRQVNLVCVGLIDRVMQNQKETQQEKLKERINY